MSFKKQIKQGIPSELPEMPVYDSSINSAPKRKDILTAEEKELALRNALRYFDKKHHEVLLPEFAKELEDYGTVEQMPKLEGKRMTMFISSKKKK